MTFVIEERLCLWLLLLLFIGATEFNCTQNVTICGTLCRCSKLHVQVPPFLTEDGLKVKCGGETRISSLGDLRFDNIFTKIIQLNLSGNDITEIPAGIFSSLPNLQKLDLSRNFIFKVESGAFMNLTNLKRLDLSANRLGRIDYTIFEGLENLEKLKLNQNRLMRIREGTFDNLFALKQLDISDNPLHCDCQISWILTWAQNMSVKISPMAKCDSPVSLKGHLLRKLQPDSDFPCDVQSSDLLELQPSHDQVVFEGDSLQLRCRAPSITQDRGVTFITWIKESTTTSNTNSLIESSMLQESGLVESSLDIQHLSQEHSGQWNCILVSDQGNQTQAITLIVISKETKYCPQTVTSNNKGVYIWPKTVVGHTVVVDCQGEQIKGHGTGPQQAHHNCTIDGQWDALDTSACPYTSHITNVLEQFSKANLSLPKTGILESARRLRNFTGDSRQLKDKMDIVFISRTINNYLSYVPKEKELGAVLLDIVSSLMNLPKSLMAAAQVENGTCTDLVSAVEVLAESVPMPSHKSNLAVEKFPFKKEDFPGMTCRWYDHSGKVPNRLFICSTSNSTSFLESKVIEASVQVPSTLFYQLEKQGHSVTSSRQLLVSVFENNWLFPSIPFNSSRPERDITSCVIGAKLAGIEVANLTEPVYVMLRAPLTGDSPKPAWWNPHMNEGAGGWSTKGCQLSHLLHGLLVFQCDRLGYFGLLQKTDNAYDAMDRLPGAKFRYSHPTIYFGSFVNVICLMTTIVTYIVCHESIQMSKKSKHSLVNTWIAMAVLCFLFSIGIYQTEDIKICQSVGLLLHYLTLCSLLWMAVSVSHIHKRLSRSPETTDTVNAADDDGLPSEGPVPEPLLGLYLVGWGVALIVCGISGAVNLREYAGRRRCFLSGGPALGAVAVPCCALVLLLAVLLALAARAASARTVDSDPGEGTQATENLDLETLTPPPLATADRESYHSEDTSEAEDGERPPAAQVRAHAVTLVLFLVAWGSAAAATVHPIPGFLRQEALFGTLFGFSAAALGLFIATFYCVGRRDVRTCWAELRYGEVVGQADVGRRNTSTHCCRTRSVSDTAPVPVPQATLTSVSTTTPVPKIVEANGVAAQTLARTDNKRGLASVNVVLLPRQPAQYVIAAGAASDPPGGINENAEMFYNPRQSTVARKFFRKQRRHAAGLAARRSAGAGVASDTDTRAESAVFLSSDMENASSNVAASLPRIDYSWPTAHSKRQRNTATNGALSASSDEYGMGDRLGPPLERLVIGAEEAAMQGQTDDAGQSEATCSQTRPGICPVPEVEEPTASSAADLSESVDDDMHRHCKSPGSTQDNASVSGGESLICGTGSGPLGAAFDTDDCRTDGERSSWREEESELGSETVPESSTHLTDSMDSVSVSVSASVSDILRLTVSLPTDTAFEPSSYISHGKEQHCRHFSDDSTVRDSLASAPIVTNGDRDSLTGIAAGLETLCCNGDESTDFEDQLVNKKETSV